MRLRRFPLLLMALALAIAPPLPAQRGPAGGHSSPRSSTGSAGRVHVRGYTRKDGVYVAPHERRVPDSYSAPRPSPAPPSVSPRAPRASRSTGRAPSGRSPSATPAPRDSRGRIQRNRSAKDDFMRASGHPHGWPGHVVDHVVPLCAGGVDAPSNMQWQTIGDAKVKDRQERATCSGWRGH